MAVLSDADIAGYAYNAGWRGNDVAIATAIAIAESGGDPSAISPTNHDGTKDYGLWQINNSHASDSGLWAPTSGTDSALNLGLLAGTSVALGNKAGWSDPAKNAAYAYKLWQGRGGFGDWSTYNNGRYLLFMGRGTTAAQAPNTAVSGGSTVTDSPVSGVGDMVDAVKSIAGTIFKASAWSADPHNWARVAFVLVGGSMVIGALIVAARPYLSGAAGTVADVASTVTPAGAIAGAASKAAKGAK